MIDETYKLLAVASKLRRINRVDHRKIAFKNALETYFKKEIDNELTDKIILITKDEISQYEEDKVIRLLSHTLVKEVIHSCLCKFDTV